MSVRHGTPFVVHGLLSLRVDVVRRPGGGEERGDRGASNLFNRAILGGWVEDLARRPRMEMVDVAR